MSPLIIGPIFEMIKATLDRVIPDKGEKARAEAEFLVMLQEQSFKQILAQLEINAKEAQHPSIWVAGWRPFCGWTGGFGLAYSSILHPFLTWLAAIHELPPPPVADSEILWVVLTGLLGIGGLRTIEKTRK